jgi:hypothetical protein
MFKNYVSLGLLVITAVVIYWTNSQTKQGKIPFVRKIPALDAIDEAVGRATEMGRPVYFPIGTAPTGGTWTAGNLAALSMIHRTGVTAANMGTKQIVGTTRPDLIPMIDDVMKSAYLEGDEPDLYTFDDIRWFPSQMAFVAGTAGMYAREPAGAQIMIGSWMAETLAFCEIGSRGGAFMIGGTDYRPYMPYMLATCDYALIGEEIFVASAYVTDEPAQKASIWAEDLVKWAILALTIGSSVLFAVGFDKVIQWLGA